jgi:tRNA modification GTPase
VVRLSGPEARAIAGGLIAYERQLEPRHATLTLIRLTPEPSNGVSGIRRTVSDAIDQVVVTYFPAPHSYTGEDVVEVSAHGSPVVLRAIDVGGLDGARLDGPGSSRRARF